MEAVWRVRPHLLPQLLAHRHVRGRPGQQVILHDQPAVDGAKKTWAWGARAFGVLGGRPSASFAARGRKRGRTSSMVEFCVVGRESWSWDALAQLRLVQ